MTFGDWIITLLLLIIPLVNIILLIIWAFGSGHNPNKSNFAKAYLIFLLIGFVLFTVILGASAFVIADLFEPGQF